MMNTPPLHIGKKDKVSGLTVYCNACKRDITDVCMGNNEAKGKDIERCPNTERHVYKVYAHIPNTRNGRKSKTLQTKDLQEAKKQAIDFLEEVKNTSFQPVQVPKNMVLPVKVTDPKPEQIPHLLLHALARHIAFLRNENVPLHRQKERSEEHIKDVQRSFDLLLECLQKNGQDVMALSVGQINDQAVGQVYEYMLKEKGFANRTLNKYLGYYTSFIAWYGEEFDVPLKNFFEKVQRKRVVHNPQAITSKEFGDLLERITPENGIRPYDKGKKKIRNVYRFWLKYGFKLALQSGRRREEVIELKFNNIIQDGEGNSFVKVPDFKVNRSQNRIEEQELKYIYIPVTKELRELLDELDFEKYKNSDTYILAPEITKRSKAMLSDLSRGFSHYYDQLNTGRKLTFKCLRKTYITNLSIYMGGNAKAITQHSDDKVIEEHYLDKQELAKAAQGFQVFSKENERKTALQNLRSETMKNKEVEHEK